MEKTKKRPREGAKTKNTLFPKEVLGPEETSGLFTATSRSPTRKREEEQKKRGEKKNSHQLGSVDTKMGRIVR